MSFLGKILKKDTKELNRNTKIDSENPNTRIKKIKIKKGEAKELIRRLGITHTQKFVSLLDTCVSSRDTQYKFLVSTRNLCLY